jgi:Type III restriction enzyme, res subunit
VPVLLPSNVDALIADLDRQKDRIVVVSTIQALQQIHSLHYSDYNKLVGRFNVVIFDEGHREPAPSWAAAARGLLARTILMSATPFRNDLKLCEVDLDHVDFLSFEEAVRKHIIRDIEISEEALSFDAGAFASRCIALRDQLIKSGRFESTSKMIVRAASEHTVQSLYDAFCDRLKGRNDGVIAIHDRFADEGHSGAQKLSEVPSNLRDRTERFLIHQYKLTEGIDDRSCAMLAIFENFSNERQLVQQIGRVTRNPAKIGERCAPAYVLARSGDGVSNMFERFRRFDQACIDADGKPPLRNDKAIVSEILKVMPNADYIAGKFRARTDLDDNEIDKDLRFPKSAIVYLIVKDFDLDKFQAHVSQLLFDDDRQEFRIGSVAAGACRFHVSTAMRQSPFLEEGLFQSTTLEVACTRFRRHRVRCFDGAGGGSWRDGSLRESSSLRPCA